MLANIFLHYVLNLWFEKRIEPQMAGEVYLVRYADDFLSMAQKKSDACIIEQNFTMEWPNHKKTL